MILAGDIGGTKTHLALFEKGKMVAEEKFASREHSGLSEIIHLFLEKKGKVAKACFGIAGPIQNGRCQATNLPWVIESQELRGALQVEDVFLINDLEANAYGIPCLAPEEIFILNEGISSSANQALISAGTGLGEAGLFWDGSQHLPFACEGGHTDFAPRSELEMELLRYLRKKFGGHVSYERLLSGAGIFNLYQFLVELRLEKPSADFEGEDPARIITRRALEKSCKTCERTLRWFVTLYGAESGNLALKMLAVGGMYIGGGIAPKILPALKEENFMKAFMDKGRFSSLLSQIPVKVILNENTALLGAERYAQERK